MLVNYTSLQRSFIAAGQAKAIADRLKEKRVYLVELARRRIGAVKGERFIEANELKNEYDSIWFTCTDEFRHLPKFMKGTVALKLCDF